MQQDKLLRVKEVAEKLSIGVTTVWLYAREGKLPKPTKISPRVTVWKESDINKFIEDSTSTPK